MTCEPHVTRKPFYSVRDKPTKVIKKKILIILKHVKLNGLTVFYMI